VQRTLSNKADGSVGQSINLSINKSMILINQ